MKLIEQHAARLAFVFAVAASLGSLFLSEVLGLAPCVLCWVQRCFMYTAAVLLGISVYKNDEAMTRYALAVSVLGMITAGYHYFIQWFPQLEISVCASGNPCTNRDVMFFGFVTIPFMSFISFMIITVLLMLNRKHRFSNNR